MERKLEKTSPQKQQDQKTPEEEEEDEAAEGGPERPSSAQSSPEVQRDVRDRRAWAHTAQEPTTDPAKG